MAADMQSGRLALEPEGRGTNSIVRSSWFAAPSAWSRRGLAAADGRRHPLRRSRDPHLPSPGHLGRRGAGTDLARGRERLRRHRPAAGTLRDRAAMTERTGDCAQHRPGAPRRGRRDAGLDPGAAPAHPRLHGRELHECRIGARGALKDGLRPSIVVLDINLPDATGWTLPDSPELRDAGLAAGADRLRVRDQLGATGQVAHRRLSAQAIPIGDVHGRRWAARPPGRGNLAVNDLIILVIAIVCVAALAGYLLLVDRVR